MTTFDTAEFNTAKERLDARGLLCPQPIIKARHWLQKATSGDRLHIVITDPHGPLDFEVFCQRTGHCMQSCVSIDSIQPIEWHILVQCK